MVDKMHLSYELMQYIILLGYAAQCTYLALRSRRV